MLSTVEKVLFLKSIDLFSQIPGDSLAQIALIATEESREVGEQICGDGEFADALYLVVEGKLRDPPAQNFARGLSGNHARKAGDCTRNHQGGLPSAARRGSMSAFQPYVPPSRSLPELTARGLIVGSVLGVLFAASSVYL